MNKITKLATMLSLAAGLSMTGVASAHWHQPQSWVHRDHGHGWYGHGHDHGYHGDHGHTHHHHSDCGCGGGLFSLFTRRVVVHHYYPPPPPVYCAPSLYPRPTAGREEPKRIEVREEEVWTGKDKKHSSHRRRSTSGSGSTGSTD